MPYLRPVTWQLSRLHKLNPTSQSGTLYPTFPRVVIGAWSGSWCPASSEIRELAAGSPLVGLEIIGFLPAEAGRTIAAGDVLLRLEDATTWQVLRADAMPSRCVVMLKTATEKKNA